MKKIEALAPGRIAINLKPKKTMPLPGGGGTTSAWSSTQPEPGPPLVPPLIPPLVAEASVPTATAEGAVSFRHVAPPPPPPTTPPTTTMVEEAAPPTAEEDASSSSSAVAAEDSVLRREEGEAAPTKPAMMQESNSEEGLIREEGEEAEEASSSSLFSKNGAKRRADEAAAAAPSLEAKRRKKPEEVAQKKNVTSEVQKLPRRRLEDDPTFPFVDLHKVGQGTYGAVYRALRRPGMRREHQGAPGEKVALKRLILRDDDWGFSITSLRECNILKMLRHDNLVRLYECYSATPRSPDIFMVFEYVELDLEIVIQSPAVKQLDGPRVKSLMQQLLEGVMFMHRNQIMHRDLKPSNLLVSSRGDLKVADFGLARSFKPGVAYSNPVITLNYRPPEVALGCRHYGLSVDMWSCGAIFGELLTRKVILAGRDDASYLGHVWALCGTPVDDWAEARRHCPKWTDAGRKPKRRTVQERFAAHDLAAPLIDRLLALHPHKRYTAPQALDDRYFWEGDEPLPSNDRALPWDVNTVRAAREDHLRRIRTNTNGAPAQG